MGTNFTMVNDTSMADAPQQKKDRLLRKFDKVTLADNGIETDKNMCKEAKTRGEMNPLRSCPGHGHVDQLARLGLD